MIFSRLHQGASISTVSLALCFGCATELDQPTDPRAELLVSAEWLAEHLDDTDLVILHVGDSADGGE